MSLATFLFPAKSQTKIGNITIDAAISLPESNSATITTNPIETGTEVSDGIYYQPMILTITGRISDYDFNRTLNVLKQNFFGKKGKTVADSAYYALKALYESKTPFQIVTSRRIYDNMLFSNFNVQVDATTAQTLAFTATAQEILYAKAVTIKIPRSSVGDTPANAKDQQQSPVDEGTQPANGKDNLRKSALASIVDETSKYIKKFN